MFRALQGYFLTMLGKGISSQRRDPGNFAEYSALGHSNSPKPAPHPPPHLPNAKHQSPCWMSCCTESVATFPPFGPIEGQKWFDQISSQWESQKNRFALIYFGKIQILPPCIWNIPSYHLGRVPAIKVIRGILNQKSPTVLLMWLLNINSSIWHLQDANSPIVNGKGNIYSANFNTFQVYLPVSRCATWTCIWTLSNNLTTIYYVQ